MISHIKRYAPIGISLFAAVVFLDSLRFKFTDHPNTQEIFGRLDGWAGALGAPGLFGHTGLFSQYVIGSAELLASSLLLIGLLPRFTRLNALGALIGFAVMSGAVSFHLFTPLGIDPNNDGGGLFAAALTIWFSALALLVIRRGELIGLAGDLAHAFIANAKSQTAPMRAPAHA
ncbi:MAG: hypothetical protein M0D54_05340 [Hyphomonadaceae bacterium JAD_PAG50586_4]|nr:MAG: hypothetical protein M0D54_05340 [Hyphomonadaceae bacterium JAD_PAG50586_4]